MKNEKGITLIALVITIIVLLILAGVSIAMLGGDNGLLSKSQESAAQTAIAGAKDEVGLIYQESLAEFLETKYTDTEKGKTQSLVTIFSGKVNQMSDAKKHECTVTASTATGTVTVKYSKNGTDTIVYGKLTATSNAEKLEWVTNNPDTSANNG